LPWDVNLFFWVFFWVCLFDFVAIPAMFMPYLRTFFRIKATGLSDCPIPCSARAGQKNKVAQQHDLLGHERRRSGYNLFQIPFQVAKLKIDENGTSIGESEIRLSPSLPVATVLFVWFFYRVFSTLKLPVNGPSPIRAAGIVALIVLVVSVLTVRKLR
jgi:hypothetical protein